MCWFFGFVFFLTSVMSCWTLWLYAFILLFHSVRSQVMAFIAVDVVPTSQQCKKTFIAKCWEFLSETAAEHLHCSFVLPWNICCWPILKQQNREHYQSWSEPLWPCLGTDSFSHLPLGIIWVKSLNILVKIVFEHMGTLNIISFSLLD